MFHSYLAGEGRIHEGPLIHVFFFYKFKLCRCMVIKNSIKAMYPNVESTK